jgi:membrane protease YdiL (CAAX protease family)
MTAVAQVRRVPTSAVVATLAVIVVGHMLFWMVAPVSSALDAIATWSGSLIQPTLTINVAELLALLVCWFGILRLQPSDVGLESRDLRLGLFVLLGGWLAIQLIRLLAAIVVGQGIAPSAVVESGQIRWLLGAFLGQVVGNALGEELVHRGLILRQIFQRLRRGSERQRLVRALVLGSTLFALLHILMLINRGYVAYEVAAAIVVLAGMGCYFAAIYLRTGNLFVAIAVHALSNVPGDVVASPLDGRLLAFALGLSLIAIGPARLRRERSAA